MIISDSTPLIAFARIGELPLLKKIVGSLIIPTAVAHEISEHGRDRSGSIDLSQESWIDIQAVQFEQQVHLLLPTLDRGEAEVIALALEQTARLVLMDELTGRQVAQSLGLTITGSVGILIRAKQLGEIRVIKPCIDEMIRQGIRYSQRFINEVLQSVGE
jgi:predicted nucleic acid-binding protein